MAPTPHGAYWREGMKLGYQDCGAWTFLDSTPPERRRAAWLYAQFCTCKSVSLKKTMVGLTPIRDSDIRSAAMREAAPRLGGLVEFYAGPARDLWTPTGVNVPHYPLLSQVWWPILAAAVDGRVTAKEAMERIAADQDAVFARLAEDPALIECPPALAEPEDPAIWLARDGAPWPALEDEEGQGETVPYDELIAAWRDL
jgi:glycerol transport system substrate-binding protein